jgi:hypothetical protein
MATKLNSGQLAKLAILETFPPKFDQIHRAIEELSAVRVDESVARRLARLLDEMKAAAQSIGEGAVAETCGIMGTMARRTGGHQTRIRGLRENFSGLKVNFEGAMRGATREEDKDEVDESDLAGPKPSP